MELILSAWLPGCRVGNVWHAYHRGSRVRVFLTGPFAGIAHFDPGGITVGLSDLMSHLHRLERES